MLVSNTFAPMTTFGAKEKKVTAVPIEKATDAQLEKARKAMESGGAPKDMIKLVKDEQNRRKR